MKKTNSIFLILAFSVSFSWAKIAPDSMNNFNVVCPAESLCKTFDNLYYKSKKDTSYLHAYVNIFKKLCEEYDCQRPFDHKGQNGALVDTINYIVPALWLCKESRIGDYDKSEDYINLLFKFKSKHYIMEFLGSRLFRKILDGALAEEYLDKSKEIERKLKKEH